MNKKAAHSTILFYFLMNEWMSWIQVYKIYEWNSFFLYVCTVFCYKENPAEHDFRFMVFYMRI